MRRKSHVRFRAGENLEIISKSYLLLFPKIEGIEMMFSAARSRGLMIVAIVQGLIQLERNYGKEGAQIIRDNCQLTIFGGFAPGSETANTLSADLGEQTVLSGTVSKGKDSNSRSLQMMGRRLMTPDELKAMPVVSQVGNYFWRTLHVTGTYSQEGGICR